MTTSRINAYRWPARLVSHKPFAAERYFITSSSIWQVFFAENYDFSFFIFSVLSIAAFSVQDAQSRRFLPVENSPVPLCSISMGGKGGGYTYYIGDTPSVCSLRSQPPSPRGRLNSLSQSLPALTAPSGREPTLSGSLRSPAPPKGELFAVCRSAQIKLPLSGELASRSDD